MNSIELEIGASAEEALAYINAAPPPRGANMADVPLEKLDSVRFGFIGLGTRGFGQLKCALAVEGVRVTAVCDFAEDKLTRARDFIEGAGYPLPAMERDWRRLCARDDIDLMVICSPWNMHVPQAIYAMECGKHVGLEVPAAQTLADCWLLVDTSEHTRRHCIMLENCCYGNSEMMALNMVRAGLFGTITHGEAAYVHDLRKALLQDVSLGLWRREPHKTRNGNFYPTHGLGPVAWYMNIHHGDRLARMVSMSSPSAALQEYRDANLPENDPKRREIYRCGDINSSLIRTECGRTILLQHDIVTPRPYTRLNFIAGSKGAFSDYPPRVFLDGQSKHQWRPIDDELKAQYEHPLWRQFGEKARKDGGHGGMDYIMFHRLAQTFRAGLPPDINVYDAAAWSAPGPLSEISVAWNNLAVPFPDFTRGNWQAAPAGRT